MSTMSNDELIAYINGAIDLRLRTIEVGLPLLMTRIQVIKEIGKAAYDRAVKEGQLTPIKGPGANSKVRFRRKEIEQYLDSMAAHV